MTGEVVVTVVVGFMKCQGEEREDFHGGTIGQNATANAEMWP
jgi:hypothetical protein